ncbi:MAG TPA: cytochrome c [Candidatus Acidoferrales bacterium]|nr:cytochrome c [Candidatus Acidoferrales bacterium]
MQRGLPVLAALIFAGSAAIFAQSQSQQQESQKPAAQAAAAPTAPVFVIPAEYDKKPNPVKATPESLAEGKKMYGYDCAMCHGAAGDGKGDLAADMKLTLKDYRDAASLKDLSDGDIFYIIDKGKGQMTGEEGRQKPDEIWNMINFVRSLAKKSPPAKTN